MKLFLPGPAGRLEAELWMPEADAPPRAAAVVCHPHPLHGGTMHNTVVFRVARALHGAGLAVLRFNFRGVEESEGASEGDRAEEGDLAAALDYLEAELPGVELWAAGFSFGARTVVGLCRRDPRPARVVLVALPCAVFDCSDVAHLDRPGLIVMAGEDEFGNLAELRRRFPDLDPRLELAEIPATDHFFRRRTPELEARVRDWALAAEPAGRTDGPRA